MSYTVGDWVKYRLPTLLGDTLATGRVDSVVGDRVVVNAGSSMSLVPVENVLHHAHPRS